MPALDDLLARLAEPTAYPDADWAGVLPAARRVEVVQTHISAVFLTARRAYKVKKPVRLWGFVDYGTLEARRAWCHEEVRLNRRLAPDLYLGVAPIVEHGASLRVAAPGDAAAEARAVEHAVVMHRFRPEATLAHQVAAGTVDVRDLGRLGTLLGRFHREHRLGGADRARLRACAFARVLRQNVRSTRPFVPALFPAGLHEELQHRLADRLFALRGALRERLPRAVDGHGDVRLEHVLAEGGRLSVIDCVEFTTRLRHIDPLSDAAFLVMDLLANGAPRLALRFAGAYRRAAADRPPTALWALYAAYRAHVRAKVDATTSREPEVPAAQRAAKARSARGFLCLALSLLRAEGGRPPLVLLRGPSGSGKSVLARAVGPWMLAEVVRSDVLRKRRAGLAPLARPDAAQRERLYSPAATAATYAAVRRAGLAAVARGCPALLDATWLRRAAREEVYAAARARGVPVLLVDCHAPPEVIRERLRARALRGDDPSDADAAVYEAQRAADEPVAPDEPVRRLPYGPEDDPSDLLLRLMEAAGA